MTPGPIRFQTHALGKPRDWDEKRDGECSDLPVRQRGHMIESAWYPTPDELTRLANGEPVILTVWGGHPAVSLNVNAGEKDG